MKIYVMSPDEQWRRLEFKLEMLERKRQNRNSYYVQEFRKRASHWRNRALLQFMDNLNQPLN